MSNTLITNIKTIAELKELYIETFLNHTNEVSKITDLSVLNAHAFGVAKLLQKDLKETAILESQIFPQLSSGVYLDNAAHLVGGVARLDSSGSSTFVLVKGEVGTTYVPGVTSFSSSSGVQFDIKNPVVIGIDGYSYIEVSSTGSGSNTNVDALSINSIKNPPIGHVSCTNEYAATGGRDVENDEDFKIRLSTFGNLSAKETLANILENLKIYDNRVLRIFKYGFNDNGKIVIKIVNCNGSVFLSEELRALENRLSKFISLSDLNYQGGNLGIELMNVEYTYIPISFRIKIISGYNEADVRKNIQINITKYLNFKYWDKNKVEWDNLLEIVKGTKGVEYIPDEYFSPHLDITLDVNKPPRVKGFIMYDLDGNILYNNDTAVLPIYYN